MALSAAFGFVSVLMLLAVPARGADSWFSHFRAHEVRRSVLRHTLLERTSQRGTAEEAYKYPPRFVRLVDDSHEADPKVESNVVPAIRVNLFLVRLKLSPPQPGGQDPLLE